MFLCMLHYMCVRKQSLEREFSSTSEIERVEWLSFENKGSSNCLMLTDRVLDQVLIESNHFFNRSRSEPIVANA